MELNATYTSLVAVGDSFTEGMSDLLPDGTYRGWADVLASRLAARSPNFRYANLAVRGKLISQIVDEQVRPAAAMQADVVTLVGGLNDTLRPKCDMGMVRGRLEEAVELLAPSCKKLVLMRSPGRNGPVFDRFRPRMEALFALIDDLADRHGASVVDLYSAPSLSDPRMWDFDRLHLAAEGHRRVAEAVWQTLGLPPELDWQAAVPASLPPRWANRRADDIRFARRHLGPWIGRRLTGRSSGDGRWGAQFDAGTASAFWITPTDAAAPGPVTGWRRAEDLPQPGPLDGNTGLPLEGAAPASS
ncbi:Lipolytic protein G-D-S-L family [Streptomyces microflavus DSM 40593]|uniref:Lipolytic protein G-D-S-L family n=1 Tax=Streptomyces microflavus DSM 40593 TaxID=1303692 RepID=N0CJB4_STRMI|nr:SGNH/GDSL hydrolase family protein [Streptomyces microflavus]AGK75795.1 Lipolytic protein G-D-S-L family [Streptomyces microflavus DSM 40593]